MLLVLPCDGSNERNSRVLQITETSSHSRNQTASQLQHEYVTSPFEMNRASMGTVADKELIGRHQR